jgi:hypothetical protein
MVVLLRFFLSLPCLINLTSGCSRYSHRILHVGQSHWTSGREDDERERGNKQTTARIPESIVWLEAVEYARNIDNQCDR